MYNASDLRKGLKIEIDGVPHAITEFQFVKPGKGQAMYKTRLKNLINGSTYERTFRAVNKIGKPDLRNRDMTYSYPEGDEFVFIDEKTYEQIHISKDALGDSVYFLEEDMPVEVLFHNDVPIDIKLPQHVIKEITETEPGIRGDTATNVMKPAKIANGYELNVPLFINIGDTVKIETENGTYVERMSKGAS